ncbi:MAG: hypothetical protein JXQ26_01495 [Tissierellales bacterium]|nr:hypothetical protein [Tissierellales bacterium]
MSAKNIFWNEKWIAGICYYVMVWSLASIYGRVLGVSMEWFQELLTIIFVASLVLVLIRKPFLIYAILVAALVLLFMIERFLMPITGIIFDRTMDIGINLQAHFSGGEDIKAESIVFIWIAMVVILSSFTGVILNKNKKTSLLLIMYLISFVYYWYVFVDAALMMMLVFLAMYFFMVGSENYFSIKRVGDEKSDGGVSELYPLWMQTAIRYAILIIVLSYFLPKGYQPLNWEWLNKFIYDLFPIVEDMRGGSQYTRGSVEASPFDLTFTSYLESSGRLGGPVILDDQRIMTVRADGRYYLRGNVRQIYTGTHWENGDNTFTTYKTGQNFGPISEEEDPHFREKTIDILHHYFASKTIFGPWKTVEVEGRGNQKIRVNEDGIILMSDGIYKGEGYSIRIQQPIAYQVLLAMQRDEKKDSLPNLQAYLNLPSTVSTRTIALTCRITEGMEDDYQKAIAIESYLRNNYIYDLQGENLPENDEFVDFFLFKSKRGYCTYFATAMAVMLRIEGIPSRYVEGYTMGDKIEGNVYEVTQKEAHAWVEAFIEPVGWMNFEPTPSLPWIHQDESERIWADMDRERELYDEEETGPKKKLREDLDYDFLWDHNDNEVVTTEEDILLYKLILWLVIVLMGIVPIKFMMGVLNYMKLEKRIKQMPPKERVQHIYQSILVLLALSGYACNKGETPYEFSSRIAYKFYYRDEIGIMEVTDIFVRSKYSLNEVSEEEAQAMFLFKEKLEKRLRKNIGAREYYVRKYFYRKLG